MHLLAEDRRNGDLIACVESFIRLLEDMENNEKHINLLFADEQRRMSIERKSNIVTENLLPVSKNVHSIRNDVNESMDCMSVTNSTVEDASEMRQNTSSTALYGACTNYESVEVREDDGTVISNSNNEPGKDMQTIHGIMKDLFPKLVISFDKSFVEKLKYIFSIK